MNYNKLHIKAMVFETKQITNKSEIFSKNKFQANRKWGKIYTKLKKKSFLLCADVQHL